MEHRPRVRTNDVATDSDLDVLDSDLDAFEQHIARRLDNLGSQLSAGFRRDLRIAAIVIVAGNAAVVVVAAALTDLF